MHVLITKIPKVANGKKSVQKSSESLSFGNLTIAYCIKKLPSNGKNIWSSVHHYKEEHSRKVQSWKDGVVLKQQKVKYWNYPTIHCCLMCCANCYYPLAEWNEISRTSFSHTLLEPGNEFHDFYPEVVLFHLQVVTFSHPPTERISNCTV